MRIISGTRRGHKLAEIKGDDIRPTTDRVKESIFNLISEHVSDAVVLDMFSGSGALSFEALSRGASRAVCIDADKRSVAVIQKNAEDLGFTDLCEIVNQSCFDYVKRTNIKFDIVFLDPPYNKGFIEPALRAIVENNILSQGGIAVLESDSTDFNGDISGLTQQKQRRYGRTYITVYGVILQEDKDKINENSSISR